MTAIRRTKRPAARGRLARRPAPDGKRLDADLRVDPAVAAGRCVSTLPDRDRGMGAIDADAPSTSSLRRLLDRVLLREAPCPGEPQKPVEPHRRAAPCFLVSHCVDRDRPARRKALSRGGGAVGSSCGLGLLLPCHTHCCGLALPHRAARCGSRARSHQPGEACRGCQTDRGGERRDRGRSGGLRPVFDCLSRASCAVARDAARPGRRAQPAADRARESRAADQRLACRARASARQSPSRPRAGTRVQLGHCLVLGERGSAFDPPARQARA